MTNSIFPLNVENNIINCQNRKVEYFTTYEKSRQFPITLRRKFQFSISRLKSMLIAINEPTFIGEKHDNNLEQNHRIVTLEKKQKVA